MGCRQLVGFLSSNTQDFIEVAKHAVLADDELTFLSSNTQDFIEVSTSKDTT